MLVAIASDIHGNRPAFEAVIEAAEASGAEELWCLGDLVGYGAEPNECVALAQERCAVCLAGNHDLAITGALSLSDFSRSAALAAEWTRNVIEPARRDFLAGLAPAAREGDVGLFHASPRDPVWEYVLSTLAAELCLDAAPTRTSLIGHSHVALAFERRPGSATTGAVRRAGDAIDLAPAEWLLNPGSVGQPRDGDPRAAWLLLDTTAGRAEWRREDYDVRSAMGAIRAAGLPDQLAERLRHGQ